MAQAIRVKFQVFYRRWYSWRDPPTDRTPAMTRRMVAAGLVVSAILQRGFGNPAPVSKGVFSKLNKGTVLDVSTPATGAWPKIAYDAAQMKAIAEAGFESVRLIIPFPQTLDSVKTPQGVQDQINDAFANKLSIVICIWGMGNWAQDVTKGATELAERWGQLARLWKDYSSDLVFEIMNEPAGIGFGGDAGNANAMKLYDAAIQAIRNEDPTRPVLIGPPGYNDAEFLQPYVTKEHLKYTFDGGKGFYEDPNVGAAIHFYTPRGENGINWAMWTQPLGTGEVWGNASKWQGPITDQIMYAVNWRKSIGHEMPIVTTEWGCWLFPERDQSPDLPAWLDFTMDSLKANNIGSMWYTSIMNNQRVFGIFDSETGWNLAVLGKLTGVHPTTWPSINQVVNGEFLPGDMAWQLSSKTITQEIIFSGAYSGSSMLKLTVPAGSSGQLYTQTYSGTDDKGPGRTLLHLIQGRSYKIKFMVGTDAGQQGLIPVSLRQASDGSLIEEFKAIDVSAGPTTSVISYKHQAANAMDVRLQFDVSSMKQVLYLDKVEILSNTDESLAYVTV